ncbi:hypothetical protein Tco_0615988 [Tanacetum coccineum]
MRTANASSTSLTSEVDLYEEARAPERLERAMDMRMTLIYYMTTNISYKFLVHHSRTATIEKRRSSLNQASAKGLTCMTRSSTNKLFTPYKELEREFQSSRRHFKTLSLEELRSPDFNLFSDQEYSKEEVAETMAETMEQYMSKTRSDYGSGVARPKIEDKDKFELKGRFLKELPFLMSLTGAKMEEINNFQQEPDENLYQAWERFKELLMKCPQHYLTEMQEVILFYNGLGIPTRQILDSRGAIPSKTAANAKVAIQEMAE